MDLFGTGGKPEEQLGCYSVPIKYFSPDTTLKDGYFRFLIEVTLVDHIVNHHLVQIVLKQLLLHRQVKRNKIIHQT